MNQNDEREVPLIDLLADVPEDARLVIDSDDGFSTRYIPVGRYCHEARAALASRQEVPQGWRDLVREARDNCEASIVEDGISSMRREYRKELLTRLDAMLASSPQPEAAQSPAEKERDAIAELNHQQWLALSQCAALVSACHRLSAESEEYDFDDGLGRGAQQAYWDEFDSALERASEALDQANKETQRIHATQFVQPSQPEAAPAVAQVPQGESLRAKALRLADAIDPFTRTTPPDHLTSTVTAQTLRALAAAPEAPAQEQPERAEVNTGETNEPNSDELESDFDALRNTRAIKDSARQLRKTLGISQDFDGWPLEKLLLKAVKRIAALSNPPVAQPGQEPCGNRDYCSRFPFCGCGGPQPLPERDTSKPAEQQGLFRKFDVRRTDGSDKPGGKHHGCEYFVLDVNHDKHAPAALAAYADAVAATHPHLADDMRERYELPASTPVAQEQRGDAEWCRRCEGSGLEPATTPPAQASDAEDAAYQRGYRDGYERRDIEIKGAFA